MESGSLQLGKFVTPPIEQGIELMVKRVISTSRFTFPWLTPVQPETVKE